MYCVLCASTTQEEVVESVFNFEEVRTMKKNGLNNGDQFDLDLVILPKQRFARSLCQLLDLPSDPFEERFLQPNILFCSSCTIFLGTAQNLFNELEQLQKQIAEVRGQVRSRIIAAALQPNNQDSSILLYSADSLRNEISRVIQPESVSKSTDFISADCYTGKTEQSNGGLIVPEEFIGYDDMVFKEEIAEEEIMENSDLSDWNLCQNVQINYNDNPELRRVTKSLKVSLTRLDDFGNYRNLDLYDHTSEKEKSVRKSSGLRLTRKVEKINQKTDKMEKFKRKIEKAKAPAVEMNIFCTFPDCQDKFRTLLSRRIHLRKIHSALPPPLQCPYCPKIYKFQRLLDTHVRIHTGEKPYVCEKCGRGFRDAYHLKEHQIIHTEGERPYPCPECPKGYFSIEALRTHSVLHSGEKSFMCELCSQSFIRKIELTNHQTKFHSAELNLKQFKCQFCSKILKDKFYLRLHEKKHTGELDYKCEVCGFLTDTPSHLKHHLLSHTTERNLKCPNPDCNKTFKYRGQLIIHLRDHTGERNYKCTNCPKAFKIAEQLKRHVAVAHSTLTPFKCPLCGDAFPVRKYLNRHTQKHRLGKIPTPGLVERT